MVGQSLPILYVTGSHFEVGYQIGKTFKNFIYDYLAEDKDLADVINFYQSNAGQEIYNEVLHSLRSSFPQYLEELQGTAEGSGVPFSKLLIMHLDQTFLPPTEKEKATQLSTDKGCSSTITNFPDNKYIAHTEDGNKHMLGKSYIIRALIKEPKPRGKHQVREERFTAFANSGMLPGFFMGCNDYGLVETVNTIPVKMKAAPTNKTPSMILGRAILAARNYTEAIQILEDDGNGTADGASLNIAFYNSPTALMHNVEVGPDFKSNKSKIDIRTIENGQNHFHANMLLRMTYECAYPVRQTSSLRRQEVYKTLPPPINQASILDLLGDTSNQDYPVHRSPNNPTDPGVTIATGLFDLRKKSWAIYLGNPKWEAPTAVVSMANGMALTISD